VKHALDEHAAAQRHDDLGFWMLAQEDREAADVVEVAVGDDDEVQVVAADGSEVRCGEPSGSFRVQPTIHDEVEIADLREV